MYTDVMSWWYKRSIGIQQYNLEANGATLKYQSVALIIGVTGIGGSSLAETLSQTDTPGGLWKVYGVARRPCPQWLAKLNIHYIQCDIEKSDETLTKLSTLTDITHIFYVSWNGSEDCGRNAFMFRNILDSIIPNCPNLKHISLQTGIKHYWGNIVKTDNNKTSPHDCPFREDLPRLNQPNFYYDLEDLLHEATIKKNANAITWSVHRPALIFGFSPCSMMNIVSTLCVYAAICKHENKPLVYTGTKASWNCLVDAVDANLLAEHLVWTATEPKAKNQAFNCCNSDAFKWKHLWKVLGEEFDIMEVVGYEENNNKEQVLLEDLMKEKDCVWDEIVEKNGLVVTKMREAFWFADIAFGINEGMVSSMNTNKEYGFMGFRDSTKSFVSCIRKIKAYKFVP